MKRSTEKIAMQLILFLVMMILLKSPITAADECDGCQSYCSGGQYISAYCYQSPGPCYGRCWTCGGQCFPDGRCDWCGCYVGCPKECRYNNPVCNLNYCGAQCTANGQCGNFESSCAACMCAYHSADLNNAQVSSPCINETQKSRQIVVSGNSNYCGDLTIATSWNTYTVTIPAGKTRFDDYPFSETITVPDTVMDDHIKSDVPLTITITGNRNSLGDSRDKRTYDCTKDINLIVRYQNFYYCPKQDDLFQDFDTYTGDQYYIFDSTGELRDWEDNKCTSLSSVNNCCSSATDCVLANGQCSPENSSTTLGSERSACYSVDNIQGGWLDPDANMRACNISNSVANPTRWLDCKFDNGRSNEECKQAVDEFDNNTDTGLCCGDDSNENYLRTQVKDTLLSYEACCHDNTNCVDELGLCKPQGTKECFASGFRAQCSMSGNKPEWQITEDESCNNLCVQCDMNRDERIDLTDISAILRAAEINSTDSIYDTNKDSVIDESDVVFCSQDIIFERDCKGALCGNNALESFEKCDKINDSFNFNCPESTCGGSGKEMVFMTRNSSQCYSCNTCGYTGSCVLGQCNAQCSVDLDCKPQLKEFCFEEGLKNNGLSNYVTKLEGDAGFLSYIKDSWCCSEIGEYYIRNYGRITSTVSINAQGEYKLSFGYMALPGDTDENIIVKCGTRSIYVPVAVMRLQQRGNNFAWFTGLTCRLTAGNNTITFESNGKTTIYLAGISLMKSGNSTCDTSTCGCRDLGLSCGDGILGNGESCDDTSSKKCPKESDCYITPDVNKKGYLIGSADYCDARCEYVDAKQCSLSDGYCPANCVSDPDCPILDKCARITSCINNDGCCPSSCTPSNDNNCRNTDKCYGVAACTSGDGCCPTGCYGKDIDCGWVPI